MTTTIFFEGGLLLGVGFGGARKFLTLLYHYTITIGRHLQAALYPHLLFNINRVFTWNGVIGLCTDWATNRPGPVQVLCQASGAVAILSVATLA
jgi:hypothetical protein